MNGDTENTVEYSKSRFWRRKDEENGIVVIGLTDSGIEELGDLSELELPSEGTEVEKNEAVGRAEGSYSEFEVIVPISGTVCGVNEEAVKNLTMVMEDPLEEGWLLKIQAE